MWSTSVNDIDEERDGVGDMIIDGKVGRTSRDGSINVPGQAAGGADNVGELERLVKMDELDVVDGVDGVDEVDGVNRVGFAVSSLKPRFVDEPDRVWVAGAC